MRQPLRGHYLLLIILSLLSVVFFLGATLFNTRGEPREAIVAVTMLQDGNWILPVNNGDEIPFKPPFLHWLVALFSLPIGHVTEFTSRLPSAIAAILMTLGTYRFFAKRGSATVALLTSLITITCFEVHRAAMTCRVDMLLAALMVGAMYGLFTWLEPYFFTGTRGVDDIAPKPIDGSQRAAIRLDALRRFPWLGLLCLAGAGLTKGPVGVLLPCACVALFFLLARPSWNLFFRLFLCFFLVSFVALLPLFAWYIAAYLQPHGGERLLTLIYEENILRLLGKMTYESHVNPWYYNLMTLLAGTLPYSLLYLFALVMWLGRNSKDLLHPVTNLRTWYNSRIPCAQFSLVCLATIFIFFCIPASKRSTYLLPLYPFACYFLASLLTLGYRRYQRALQVIGYTLCTLTLIVVAAVVVVKLGGSDVYGIADRLPATYGDMVRGLNDTSWKGRHIALLLSVAIACVLLIRKHCVGRKGLVAVVFCLQLLLNGLVLPPMLNTKSDYAVAEQIAALQPEGTVYSYRAKWIEANRMHPFTINFYLGDRVIPLDKAEQLPCEGILIFSGDTADDGSDAHTQFAKDWPQLTLTPLIDPHKNSCDDRKQLLIYRFQKTI